MGIRHEETVGEDLGAPYQKCETTTQESQTEEEVMAGKKHGSDCKCIGCKVKNSKKKGGKK